MDERETRPIVFDVAVTREEADAIARHALVSSRRYFAFVYFFALAGCAVAGGAIDAVAGDAIHAAIEIGVGIGLVVLAARRYRDLGRAYFSAAASVGTIRYTVDTRGITIFSEGGGRTTFCTWIGGFRGYHAWPGTMVLFVGGNLGYAIPTRAIPEHDRARFGSLVERHLRRFERYPTTT